MTQPSVTSYFNYRRKRTVTEDICGIKNKILTLDTNSPVSRSPELSIKLLTQNSEKAKLFHSFTNKVILEEIHCDDNVNNFKTLPTTVVQKNVIPSCTSSKQILLTDASHKKEIINEKDFHLDSFITKDNSKESVGVLTDKSNNLKYKQNHQINIDTAEKSKINNDISLNDIKAIVRKPNKSEFNTFMANLKKGLSKLDEMENKREAATEFKKIDLKEFKSIEIEISPRSQTTSLSETVMTPKKTESVARKLLLSPTKNSVPAYQRYYALAKAGKPTLVLPHNYICLAEIFRCVDDVVAMYYNRKETITFDKLKQAVQRMLRKDFTESHLRQIKTVYPNAFKFSQEKVRNFGSTSKQDKYELVIVPNIKLTANASCTDADSIRKTENNTTMNPKMKLSRKRKFYNCLLEKVLIKHEIFLTSLDPPLCIDRNALIAWHPDFKIGEMSDIEKAELPQPPNVETFSSAKDVLLNMRKLLNCNARNEQPVQTEVKNSSLSSQQLVNGTGNNIEIKPELETESSESKSKCNQCEPAVKPFLNPALKGIPTFLLEKVRAHEAAKALDAMTRSSAEEQETLKLGRLPEIARLARNLFVTEKKGVLPLETVLNKLKNSYKANLSQKELEEHLKLLSDRLPEWIVFYDIKTKGVFIKLSRDYDMSIVLNKLEKLVL